MIAIWLIVLGPVVSQLVVAARNAEPVVAMCTATTPSADTQPMHGNGMVACGYCDLLADHTTLPSIAPPLPVLVMFVTIVAAPILSTRFTPLGAFPSGRPRAPPVFSRS
ncbi:DUF2946 domain-containing protein [Paraburkholderia dilworthii]|uniref:DUF2946 domain-containing protein n=1 Tax=Paraburkholderia dilworthii TaxID=948106 RepID=UPI00041A70CB|nr:DUF2946 domain-containing protein [Paraburkholderia dilworthii]